MGLADWVYKASELRMEIRCAQRDAWYVLQLYNTKYILAIGFLGWIKPPIIWTFSEWNSNFIELIKLPEGSVGWWNSIQWWHIGSRRKGWIVSPEGLISWIPTCKMAIKTQWIRGQREIYHGRVESVLYIITSDTMIEIIRVTIYQLSGASGYYHSIKYQAKYVAYQMITFNVSR